MSDVATTKPEPRMFSLKDVCVYFGGPTKPLHPSTLYRGIKKGIYPKPVKVGENISRWWEPTCEAARQKMIDSRTA